MDSFSGWCEDLLRISVFPSTCLFMTFIQFSVGELFISSSCIKAFWRYVSYCLWEQLQIFDPLCHLSFELFYCFLWYQIYQSFKSFNRFLDWYNRCFLIGIHKHLFKKFSYGYLCTFVVSFFFLSRQMSDLLEIYPGIRWALWYAAVPTLFPPYWHVTFINSISTIIYFILICIYTSFLAIKESTSV